MGGEPKNKFWKGVQRRVKSRIAVALIYAVLEWALIVLLLLHGLFSRVVTSFAARFGLRPPCILCSRLDHLFDPRHGRLAYRRLLCLHHMAEISRLSYCPVHHNLAEAFSMCESCCCTNHVEAGEPTSRRSCCDAALEEEEFYEVDLCSRWDLEGTQIGDSGLKERERGKVESCGVHARGKEEEEESGGIHDLKACEASVPEGANADCVHHSELEDTVKDESDETKVCQEGGESIEIAKILVESEERSLSYPANALEGVSSRCAAEVISSVGLSFTEIAHLEDGDKTISPGNQVNSAHAEHFQLKKTEDKSTCEVDQSISPPTNKNGDETRDHEKVENEAGCLVLGKSEVCDGEPVRCFEIQEPTNLIVDQHTGSAGIPSVRNSYDNEEIVIKPLERLDLGVSSCVSQCRVASEMDNEKAPETPVFADGVYHLHKRFAFDRREPGTDSTEGSVVTDMDGCEVLTVQQLKSALKAERQVLNALYAELEEERNASAVATNHTMAMITRLQEEKAAMQMEALQYQRMMEEQSEYDQEALQLLNELMVKREKENQELEKELEIYRKKVAFYEEKERQRITSARALERSGTSSESSSIDGSDELSRSLDGSQDGCGGQVNENAFGLGTEKECSEHPTTLDDSLADFDKERLSILDQLKELEEKLFLMGDDNGLQKDIKRIDHLLGENGDIVCSLNNGVDGFSNGFLEAEQHHPKRTDRLEGKNLLPLLDVACIDDEDAQLREEEFASNLPSQHMKFAIEEELHYIYERLNALEADREFLRHSITSLKKGEKGMDLLLEILQHLRDLRSIELRDRNVGEALR